MPADLVLLSARRLDPGTGEFLPYAALAARDGRISFLGDDRDARARAGPGSTVVDLSGAVVTAGFTDGHLHPVSGAERTMGVDLSGCRDLDAVRTALAAAARALRPGAWLRGWGLDPNAFGTAPVRNAALGEVLNGIPALIDLFDAHSALASERALELAGVDGPRHFDQDSEIVCDGQGRPTGLLLEAAACELVEVVAPRPTETEVRARTAEVLSAMAAAALTGGHAMDANGESLAVYAALEAEDALPLPLRIAPWCRHETDDAGVAELIRLARPPALHRRRHGPAPGQRATATHAIGDAAVRHVLDSVEKAQTETAGAVRHRIEHIETVPDDTVRRFAPLGVAASMQPTHCCEFTRADHTDNWSRRLGAERAGRAFRCRDLWDAGARVVLGSDWPIAPYPPLRVMAGARHRRPADLSLPPHGPDQALTALQALQGMTVNPAWAAGEETLAGHLSVGGRADLTVLADDPLKVADTGLAQLPVLLTAVGGRVTHRAAGV